MNQSNSPANLSKEVSKKFFEMHKSTTQNYEFDRMIKSTAPFLNYFGLNHLYYVKILSSGHYTTLGTYSPLQELLFTHPEMLHSTPIVRHPKHLKQEVFIESNSLDPNFLNFMDTIYKKLKTNLTIRIQRKINKGFEIFGFGTNFSINKTVNLLINELQIVNKFVDYFCIENKKLILTAHENQVDVLPFMGSYFYEKEQGFLDLPNSANLLRHMGLETSEKPKTW